MVKCVCLKMARPERLQLGGEKLQPKSSCVLFCNNIIDISKMVESALRSRAMGDKHKSNLKSCAVQPSTSLIFKLIL